MVSTFECVIVNPVKQRSVACEDAHCLIVMIRAKLHDSQSHAGV